MWRRVGDIIITGKQLDKHTCGELETLIWGRLEHMEEELDENYSCEHRGSGICQGDMHNAGLRIRLILETDAEPLNEEIELEEKGVLKK
jgi:hypothetical protein